MGDFALYGGSDEEYAAVRKHNAELEADPDSFENWDNFINAVTALEGGLNRNSSPQALATFRDAYDRLLAKFPLFFGYWKKYADAEFNIAGPESAEMVYERGVAAIISSVDLWTEYCSFKMETTHDPQLVRELFERGAACVGLDFLAHPFWDKYIEYEERQEARDRVFALHVRIIAIPMHQYARYYERFRGLSHQQPLTSLAAPETLARFRSECEAEVAALGLPPKPELELERDVRTRIDSMYYETFTRTQSEVSKRWTFESGVKRPYFHVTELEHPALQTWRDYLDFEEAEGDAARIVCLYERCLTTCALYDEFWFRYARWMHAQKGKAEEVRHIYMRASTLFVPISRPGIRLMWAYFEESCGRVDVAKDIHAAILQGLPDAVEVIKSWANLLRRQEGLEAAVQLFRYHINTPTVDMYTKAALVAEWAWMVWQTRRQADAAREIFTENVQWYADSRMFWERWFQFEREQPRHPGPSSQADQKPHKEQVGRLQRMRHVLDEMRNRSRLSAAVKMQLAQVYLDYLVQCGGSRAMKEFLALDQEMFGPASVANITKRSGDVKINGAPAPGELDAASRARAEARHYNFFELHTLPDAEAQGPADFN
ncbi:Pre-mRNA-processing factor-like protein [Emericellopsis cladophorae]|uniref:Pre-mRNA-processing factor-like protein n=1 Tax=Emericellopsis cladophorae TaxID=2686198 RepID=A0A9P9XXC4_9HYPO|nr:Pre-mRNA-processing factor-like protein [Emericellopsis cladophorae]KAI6779084.1 Pre-mRNA-processing factor-like protein [Emericellopsis cladophorae]